MPTLCPGIDCVLATPLERGAGRESGGAGGEEEAGQREEARVRLSKYKPVESYIVSWRVLGMSTLQSMLHTTVSTEFKFFNRIVTNRFTKAGRSGQPQK